MTKKPKTNNLIDLFDIATASYIAANRNKLIDNLFLGDPMLGMICDDGWNDFESWVREARANAGIADKPREDEAKTIDTFAGFKVVLDGPVSWSSAPYTTYPGGINIVESMTYEEVDKSTETCYAGAVPQKKE